MEEDWRVLVVGLATYGVMSTHAMLGPVPPARQRSALVAYNTIDEWPIPGPGPGNLVVFNTLVNGGIPAVMEFWSS